MIDEDLRKEIKSRLGTLSSLMEIVPSTGLKDVDKVKAMMEERISGDYDPYFCGNAALHISASCQRCGDCCRDAESIAISIDDCRRIAKHLGTSQKKFMMEHTRPHILDGRAVGNARRIHKAQGGHCPFYSPDLPGCSVHEVKPQVCNAAFYLSKMNLLLCEESGRFSTFPQCPSDRELRARIDGYIRRLRDDPEAFDALKNALQSSLPEVRLFHFLLRLKGMEIYFGRDVAGRMAGSLGLRRPPRDDELRPVALLYASILLDAEEGRE